MVSFICDSNLPPALARFLRSKGYAARHTSELSMVAASDQAIWQYAKTTGTIIVTKDRDFVRDAIADPGPGVLLVCTGNCSNAVLLSKFDQMLPELLRHLEAGSRVVELD